MTEAAVGEEARGSVEDVAALSNLMATDREFLRPLNAQATASRRVRPRWPPSSEPSPVRVDHRHGVVGDLGQ
ncbi:hypothetical protein [Streptomyces echinatus]|uniref:hypothetical protein n=1 Tax=Streptomyces echinatus TaxID=67293 RepID=UPI0031EA4056